MKKMIIGVIATMFMFSLAVSSVVAQVDFCEGNFDYDRDQDGSDVALFKSDFGRIEYDNPCPPDGPSPVAITGQTTCYDESGTEIDCTGTGQDGEHQSGVPWPNPRFTDNADGTIQDNLTGLIWLKNANCFELRTWNNALSDSKGLQDGECGLTDGSGPGVWRLPNIDELLSLVDRSQIAPSLPPGYPFISVRSANYWSSTSSRFDTNHAWFVWFGDGFSDFDPKSGTGYVWPVRGGH